MEGVEQLYDLLDNVNDLIQSVAPDGSLLYVNRAWREVLGYRESEVAGLNIFDVIHPGSHAHCREVFQSVMRGAKLDRIETIFVAKNGTRIVVEGSANCQMKDGQPVATRAIFRDVSERKRFEEELQQRERELRTILENSPDVILRVDSQLRFLYVNPTIEHATGVPQRDFIGKTGREVGMPEQSVIQMEACLKQVFESGQSQGLEFGFPTQHGPRDYDVLLIPEREVDGSISSVLNLFHDITGRKEVENTLREARDEMNALIAALPDVMMVLDRDGRYLKIAPTNANLLYKVPTELEGKTLHQTFPRAQADWFVSHLRRALDEGAPVGAEYMLPIAGSETWFSGTAAPMLDGRVVWVARDITEGKRAEAALRESEARFQAFMDNTPVLAYIKDKEGRFVYVNQPLLRRFDKRPEEMLGKSDFEIWPPEVAGPVREHDKIILESDTPITLEETAPTPDGLSHTWLSFKFPLRDGRGQKFLAGMSVDISERKYYERQLEDYQRRLEEAVTELERLSSMDALTGLKNRGAFTQRLDEEMARAKRYNLPLSLFILDVDKFKEINDTFGHPVGDEVLKQVASILQEQARPSDFVARIGGEEFAVITSSTPLHGAFIVAERLRRGIESAVWTKRRVTVSIGVAEISETNSESARLLEAADQALYQAKRGGRNQVARSC